MVASTVARDLPHSFFSHGLKNTKSAKENYKTIQSYKRNGVQNYIPPWSGSSSFTAFASAAALPGPALGPGRLALGATPRLPLSGVKGLLPSELLAILVQVDLHTGCSRSVSWGSLAVFTDVSPGVST